MNFKGRRKPMFLVKCCGIITNYSSARRMKKYYILPICEVIYFTQLLKDNFNPKLIYYIQAPSEPENIYVNILTSTNLLYHFL